MRSLLIVTLVIWSSMAVSAVPKIAAGSDTSFLIKSDGSLWAWGWNYYGQLGIGTAQSSNVPVLIGTGFTFIPSRIGNDTTLAIKGDDEIWAWGYNGGGLYGNGTYSAGSSRTPIKTGLAFTEISVSDHSLALRSDGSLWAWGSKGSGQLGNGSFGGSSSTPLLVGTDFIQVAAGDAHSLAIKTDGSLWAWGFNLTGELGDGTTTSRSTPVQIGTGFVQISAGLQRSFAIKADGTLWAWGANSSASLGVDPHNDACRSGANYICSNVRVPMKIGDGFTQVATGFFHTLALKADGSLWAWGSNAAGQLGTGDVADSKVPIQVGNGFVQIAAGRTHSLGIKEDGSLWAWGKNGSGQLGDGTSADTYTPKLVIENVYVESAVSKFSLTVSASGTGYGNIASAPNGISCYNPVPGTNYLVAPDCSEELDSGTTVTLSATPVDGSIFSGWSGGGCSGTASTCTVSMSAAQSVTASFSIAPTAAQALVSTYGYFDTAYAGNNTLNLSARVAGFAYYNDSGQSGLLEVYLPNATSSARLEAYDKATGARLAKTTEICGMGESKATLGKCALYRLAAGQHARVETSDSGYVVVPAGEVQNPYAFYFHFYPDKPISTASDRDWRNWAYQKAYLPLYAVAMRGVLRRGNQIAADVADRQAMLAVADAVASTALGPKGATSKLTEFANTLQTVDDFAISTSDLDKTHPTTSAMWQAADLVLSCVPPLGAPMSLGCVANWGIAMGSALNYAIGAIYLIDLNKKTNVQILAHKIIEQQIGAGENWLFSTEVDRRGALFAATLSQNCPSGNIWLVSCSMAYDKTGLLFQYEVSRNLMAKWIERTKWSAGYFPNRQKEFDDTDRLLGCVERKYANVLGAPSGNTDAAYAYLFRYYPNANLAIGTSGGRAYLYGANGALQDIGSVAERLAEACN